MKTYRYIVVLLLVLIMAASCGLRLSPRRQLKRLLKNARPYLAAPVRPNGERPSPRERFFQRAPRPLKRERPERKWSIPRPWKKPAPEM